MSKPTRQQLVQMIRDLHDHIEWCGWGDSWKRECSEPLRKDAANMIEALASEPGVPRESHPHSRSRPSPEDDT